MSQFEKATPFFASMLAQMHGMCFDKGWDEQAFSSLLSLPTTQGLLNHEGFVLCSVCRDEAEILTLGVLPEARRKKVGTHLLEALFPFLKESGVKDGGKTDLSGERIAIEFLDAVFFCCQIYDRIALSAFSISEVMSGYTNKFELRSSTRLDSFQ